MRSWLKPFVLPWLRRDPHEIERRAAGFRITGPEDRARLARLGRSFLAGYDAMLCLDELPQVARAGAKVPEHERPFFFEGAAMGYLPRGLYRRGCSAANAESDLLGLDPAFLYLYYVGLGFWLGFRYPRRPERVEDLARRLDARYAPLCYDGFGFKVGFFDRPGDLAGAATILERCAPERRTWAWQGFGRAQHFVLMDDEPAFTALAAAAGSARGTALEFGRALARTFTGVDRPDAVVEFIAQAAGSAALAPRLGGASWALTARRMNDASYFRRCMAAGRPRTAALLTRLPDLCEDALRLASDYGDWQTRTQESALALWTLDPGRGA